jgi:hypothetical protein
MMQKRTRMYRRKSIGSGALLVLVMIANTMMTTMFFPLWVVSQPDQLRIPAVEQMPNSPNHYAMRDWKQVAIDLDELLFESNRSGQFLPLLHVVNESYGMTFNIQSYVGRSYGDNEALTCLAAVRYLVQSPGLIHEQPDGHLGTVVLV